SHKTQNQRFGSLLINADLAFDFALKGTLCEGAGSAMFFAETEGELTLGSAAAFAADSVWRGNRAKQSNTPSVSPQKRRRSTFLREEGFKKKPLFIIDRVKAKSAFRSVSC
ncbi:hypothetical protein, partial [Cloacibacillus porcorum]